MAQSYKNTQVGTITMPGIGMGLVVCIVIDLMASLGGRILAWPANLILSSVMLLLVVCLIAFSSLTTVVEDGVLKVHFGMGLLIKRKIPLSDIQSAEVASNPWYYGWGIRWTPNGILWNVAGLKAVRLTFKNGKKFQIGSDDAAGLKQAIAK